MSHLKVLRGNISRQIFNSLSSVKECKKSKINSVSYSCLSSRTLATRTAVDYKHLDSPLGEIQVGNENLTEYVFSDVGSWLDAPSVVSILYYIFIKK